MPESIPANSGEQPHLTPHLVITPYVVERNGATWVHKDYIASASPWELEEHVSPPAVTESLGDVTSWAEYVKRYGAASTSFATWDTQGLKAVLDYHLIGIDGEPIPGRCQWRVICPFTLAPVWLSWAALTEHPLTQTQLIDALEDLGQWVLEPTEPELLNLLRHLRASVGHAAESELREDGSNRVSWSRDAQVRGKDGVELPAFIRIGIPVLRSAVTHAALAVRVRVTVGDGAKLLFRLSIPQADAALEAVLTQEVDRARELLGEEWVILRGSG